MNTKTRNKNINRNKRRNKFLKEENERKEIVEKERKELQKKQLELLEMELIREKEIRKKKYEENLIIEEIKEREREIKKKQFQNLTYKQKIDQIIKVKIVLNRIIPEVLSLSILSFITGFEGTIKQNMQEIKKNRIEYLQPLIVCDCCHYFMNIEYCTLIKSKKIPIRCQGCYCCK